MKPSKTGYLKRTSSEQRTQFMNILSNAFDLINNENTSTYNENNETNKIEINQNQIIQ